MLRAGGEWTVMPRRKPPATTASAPSFTRDFYWVYENLDNEDVSPEQAPTSGARTVLKWAREHRDEFVEKCMAKFLTTEKDVKPEGDSVLKPADRAQIRHIQRLLESVEKQIKKKRGVSSR